MTENLKRRSLLTGVGGALAAIAGCFTSQQLQEDEAWMGGGSGGAPSFSETGTLGDWDVHITNDYDAVEIASYPALLIHTNDGVRLYPGDASLPVRTTVTDPQMEIIATKNIEDAELNIFPTIVFDDVGESVGSIRLYQEGDA